MKFCSECEDPIYSPVLKGETPELCTCCAAREENTREQEQEETEQSAFAAGFDAAIGLIFDSTDEDIVLDAVAGILGRAKGGE